jgi:hypothetical protein
VFVTKPPAIRKLLQVRGTEEGRYGFGEDIWCNIAHEWLKTFEESWGVDKFMITDIRFPNEVEFVHRHGGKVIRIYAPEREAARIATDEARQHPSETALDGFCGFDMVVDNNPGATNIREQIYSALLEFGFETEESLGLVHA